MPLHLIKLCVGCDSVADLEDWIKQKLKEKKRRGQKAEHIHTTRMLPKRAEELTDGGSLFWVICPRITQKSEPPSVSSSARLGNIRVVWMCSAFCPRRFFSLSFCLIQSSRSATESQPTQSLMRWSAIYNSNLFIHFRRRHNAQYLCTFRHLRAPADRNVGDGPVNGRNECVFHLHCLDYGNTLAADDPRTLLHQDIEHLAMHGRPYNT